MTQYNRNKNENLNSSKYPDSRHLDGEHSHSDRRRSSNDVARGNEDFQIAESPRQNQQLSEERHLTERTSAEAQHLTERSTTEDRHLTERSSAEERHLAERNQDGDYRLQEQRTADSHNKRHPSRSERLPEGSKKRGGGKKKKNNAVFIVIIIVASCVLAFALYKIIDIFSGYKQAESAYEEIADIFIPAKEPKTTKAGETEVETTASFNWDYDALLAINGESVGWIRDGGKINYPIVHSTDENGNSKYLYTLIDGTPNDCGTLFVDKNIPTGLKGNYSIVYGHNMNDHSMFGSLIGYNDSAYYKERSEMDVYIGYDHYVYKVFAAFTTEVTSFVYTYSLDDEASFNSFVSAARSCNEYPMYDGSIVFGKNNIITLSTCVGSDSANYRYVVMLCRDRLVKD